MSGATPGKQALKLQAERGVPVPRESESGKSCSGIRTNAHDSRALLSGGQNFVENVAILRRQPRLGVGRIIVSSDSANLLKILAKVVFCEVLGELQKQSSQFTFTDPEWIFQVGPVCDQKTAEFRHFLLCFTQTRP